MILLLNLLNIRTISINLGFSGGYRKTQRPMMQELTALRSQARGAPKSSTLEESLRSGGFGVWGLRVYGFRV